MNRITKEQLYILLICVDKFCKRNLRSETHPVIHNYSNSTEYIPKTFLVGMCFILDMIFLSIDDGCGARPVSQSSRICEWCAYFYVTIII